MKSHEKISFLVVEQLRVWYLKWNFIDLKLKKTLTELYQLSYKVDCHGKAPWSGAQLLILRLYFYCNFFQESNAFLKPNCVVLILGLAGNLMKKVILSVVQGI